MNHANGHPQHGETALNGVADKNGQAVDHEVAGAVAPVGDQDTLLSVLSRRKGIVAITVAACMALGAVYATVAPKTYTAIGMIDVEPGDPAAVVNNFSADSDESLRFRHAEARMIAADSVLMSALGKIGDSPWFDSEKPKVEQLKKDLEISVDRESGWISVELSGPDRDEVRGIVDAVMNSYKAVRVEQEGTTTGDVIEVLERQRAETADRLGERRDRVLQLREEGAEASADPGQGDLVQAEIMMLSQQLIAARQTTQQSNLHLDRVTAAYEQISDEIADDDVAAVDVSPSGETEEAIQRQLALLEQQLQTLQQRYVSSNSRIRRVLRDMAALRQKQVAIAEATVKASEAQETWLEGELTRLRETRIAQERAGFELAAVQIEINRLQDQINTLDTEILNAVRSQNAQGKQIRLEEASTRNGQVTPKLSTSLAGSAAFGMLLGLVIAFIVDQRELNKPVKTDRPAAPAAPRVPLPPALGRLPTMDGASPRRVALAPVDEPHLPFSLAVGEITQSLTSNPMLQGATVAMTSPVRCPGRASATAAMAVSLASLGRQVLLVDADLEQPWLHEAFETTNDVGLAEALRGDGSVTDYLIDGGIEGLHLLVAGHRRGERPEQLISRDRLTSVLGELRPHYDLILVHSPSDDAGAAAEILALSSDAAILVGFDDATGESVAERTVHRMAGRGVHWLGRLLVSSRRGTTANYGSAAPIIMGRAAVLERGRRG